MIWWNKNKEIIARLEAIENTLFLIRSDIPVLKYDAEYSFTSLESSIDELHDKLNALLNDSRREDQVTLAVKTLDKFEDYMKNVDKLNSMVNEFKGCVAMARGSLSDQKEVAESIKEAKTVTQLCKQIHQGMLSFISSSNTIRDQYFKIDAIYKWLVGEKEAIPEPIKKPKSRKKPPIPD